MARYVTIIGRSEEIDIVQVALSVPAKVDTGAYRSSIHAGDIKVVDKNGQKVLRFSILGHKNAVIKRDIESTDFHEVAVRSSNGQAEKRYEVKLKIKLANKVFKTSFSLSDRANNLYPVLIGRTALNNRFIVDVSKSAVKVERMLKAVNIKPSDFEEGMD